MPCVREISEQWEAQMLSEIAAKSAETKGRLIPEPACDLRTAFQRDRDRIIHSQAFRRLKHKTQVFLSPESDHYRTRLTHTLEVAQIARTVARALRVNEDLTEAVALGHDLGHTPFGHAGERALNQLCAGGFTHYEQSLRVCDRLERQGKGLNLTFEVRDGILHHTKDEWAATVEGRIVRVSDRVAFLNHDLDDAVHAGFLREEDLPKQITDVLGNRKSQRIDTLVHSIVENSTDEIKMNPQVTACCDELHDFLIDRVYHNPIAKKEEDKVFGIVAGIFESLSKEPKKLPAEYEKICETEGVERAVTDYIAGMTDHYAVMAYSELYIPKFWKL